MCSFLLNKSHDYSFSLVDLLTMFILGEVYTYDVSLCGHFWFTLVMRHWHVYWVMHHFVFYLLYPLAVLNLRPRMLNDFILDVI